jgi:alanine racemase
VRDLTFVLRLQARVTQILDFDRPQGVGYGQHYRVSAGTRLATVSFGFGGGFPPGCYEHEVVVRGRPARTAGPIGMDALQIDITGRDDVAIGDWVTLLGRDGDAVASLAGLVKSSGRSPYEILRAFDVPRIYVHEPHAWSTRQGHAGESCP